MIEFCVPTRKEYLRVQKERYGRHVFGVFPAHYPREVLLAFNILPVEIWDPPLEVSLANSHLQPYICSVVKLGLELILRGKCDELDGFLFPHTCDSIQNLSSIVHDYLGLKKPVHFFYHPKAPYGDSSHRHYMGELKRLVVRLEREWGTVDPMAMKKCLVQARHLTALIRELYALRAKGALSVSNAGFYRALRLGEYLHPEDFTPLLKKFLLNAKGKPAGGPAVILSGILPNPPDILSLLDQLGVRVANDDFLNCGRRLLIPPSNKEDPFEAQSESYFAMPPCTTKDSPLEERMRYLIQKVKESRADGVIFYVVKFCEPELFDLPQMVEELRKRKVPSLVMDVELNQGLSGQLITRVQAFVEMLGG